MLESSLTINDIVEYAINNKLNSICLADKNVVHGFYKFYIKCKKNNIKPIFGIEYDDGFHKILILAKNYNGIRIINIISSILNDSTQKINSKKDIFKFIPKSNDIILIILKKEENFFLLKMEKLFIHLYTNIKNNIIGNKIQYINIKMSNFFSEKISVLKIFHAIKNKEKKDFNEYLLKNKISDNSEISNDDFEEQNKLSKIINITLKKTK